jgi:hypothetical protein
MSNVISLAEVRAARQQLNHHDPTEPARPAIPQTEPLTWRQSARGNWWTRDSARSGLHLVIYETRRGWSGRATAPDGQGWYVSLASGVGTLAEAQAWAEGWFAGVAGGPHPAPRTDGHQ